MQKDLKNIFKHGSVYMLGVILGRVVSFLMIPIYTNYLTPEDYGLLSMLSLTIDVIATFFGLGMAAAVTRSYQEQDDAEWRRRVISSSLLGSMTIMGIVAATCFLFSEQFSVLIFSSAENTHYFRLMFIAMFLTSAIELPMVFIRINLKSGRYVAISVVKLTVNLSLNILFLVVLKMGVLGILYSSILSAFIFAAFLSYSTLREVGIGLDIEKYTRMLRFGMPLIVSDISSFILTYSNRYFLNYFTDLATVGIFSLAYTFGLVLSVLVNSPFSMVWSTEMFRVGKLENGKEVFAKVLVYYLLIALTACLGLSLLSKDALRVMADEPYWGAFQYIPLISLSYVLNGVLYIAGAGTLIAGKSKYKAYSTATAMAVNLGLNFLLIPKIGAWGAAVSTLVGFLVRVVVDVYYSQKLYHVSYNLVEIFKLSTIFLVLLSFAFVRIENLLLSVLLNLGVTLLFPLLIYFTGVLSVEEKEFVKGLMRNPMVALKGIAKGVK